MPAKRVLQVELLHTATCTSYQRALPILEQTLNEAGVEPTVKVKLISTVEESIAAKFPGTPTIRINGEDIDTMAKNFTKFDNLETCRMFIFKGGASDVPPKEMILEAVRKATEKVNR